MITFVKINKQSNKHLATKGNRTYYLLPITYYFLFFLFSCTNEPYDSGDGKYSYYTAEMVDFTIAGAEVNEGVLDDGRTIILQTPLKTETLKKLSQGSGNLCRIMLYYNSRGISNTPASGTVQAQPVGADPVLMPAIVLSDTIKGTIKTDPITLTAAWQSKNGKYINLDFAVKTDSETGKPHYIGVVCDSIRTEQTAARRGESERAVVYLRLTHNQNAHLAAYSQKVFLSIGRTQIEQLIKDNTPNHTPSEGVTPQPSKILLTIPTFAGPETKEFWL